jgi:hypothetical protein
MPDHDKSKKSRKKSSGGGDASSVISKSRTITPSPFS